MAKNLIFVFFNFIFIFLIGAMNTENINDLLPINQSNLKLKIVLDSIRLKISDSLILECPIGKLKPATFMFLRKDAVDFISRFSIQLNETFETNKKSKRKENLTKFLKNKIDSGKNENDPITNERSKKDKVLLNCRWLSSDLNQEYGNLTLHLNKPKDNPQLNSYLYKYFDSKLDHTEDAPKIIASSNKVLKRKIGDRVDFICDVHPSTGAKITWYRKDDNGFINLNDELKTNRNALDIVNYRIISIRLTIKEITETDAAEYICKASNDYGEDYASYKLELISSNQLLLPRIDSFENLNVKENVSILLNCSITSYEKFGVQWFENIDCKDNNCNSEEYDYFFIVNNEYFKPLINSKSTLITHNKIQYTATYLLYKSELTGKKKYICMARNQNGLNYKVMNLSIYKPDDRLNFENFANLTISIIFLSIIILTILISLIAIVVLMRKSKSKQNHQNDNLNNFNASGRPQNEYLNTNRQNKRSGNGFHDKSLKNSQFNSQILINNLIQNGRETNPNSDKNCSTNNLYLNYKQLKFGAVSPMANSFQRLNNTPVNDISFNSNV